MEEHNAGNKVYEWKWQRHYLPDYDYDLEAVILEKKSTQCCCRVK